MPLIDVLKGTLMQSVKSVHISWSYLFGSRGVGTWGGVGGRLVGRAN